MITQARLFELLIYYPRLGFFRWRQDHSSNAKKGRVAGTLHKHGYVYIGIDNCSYKAHRLAWLYTKGAMPFADVEHADRCKSNNRWKNLRLADDSLNQANVGIRIDNTTGYKSVQRRADGQYRARIQVRKKRQHLGYFDTPKQAHAAYVKAAKKYFGEFARAA